MDRSRRTAQRADATDIPKAKGPAAELAGLIARYSPEIEAQAHDVLSDLRAAAPGAIELVYDNYNALGIGFAATEKASDVIFSIALYPRWINLFFANAIGFPDPQKLLKGKGKAWRHIVLEGRETLAEPGVAALLRHALAAAAKPLDASQPSRIIIKSVSAEQRPRRPQEPAKRKR